ncbi:hypothetical protein [Edaphobacter bradus]|uniref:hypothetical protein n=1 Tax=Edaphobacter bradus TaxID=2259016 RepID=UPI0021E00582|nr:hypothetical protein [Edaphobacter bradus]
MENRSERQFTEEAARIRRSLRTPRAAAIAGIIFSLLLITSQVLIRLSIPSDPLASPLEVVRHSKAVAIALSLTPFAGISFLWFIAVVRDHLGELEDRFFATVFLGSGLLYVAMIFIAVAIAEALIGLLATDSGSLITSGTYALARAEIYRIMNVFSIRMSGVFMISTSTIFAQTRILPRWIAFLGYALAVILLLGVGSVNWIVIVFPLWVALISGCILIQDRQSRL